MRSPRGGNPLTSVWSGIRMIQNLVLAPAKKPEIVEDYVVLCVGYAIDDLKKGDRLHIKNSDAEKLYKLLKCYFG